MERFVVGCLDNVRSLMAVKAMRQRLEKKQPELVRRYAMLAVLPEDVQMPLTVAQKLWGVGEAGGDVVFHIWGPQTSV